MYPAVKSSVDAGDSRGAQKHTFGKAVSEAPSLGLLRWETVLGKVVAWGGQGVGVMEGEPSLKGQRGRRVH